MAYIKLKDAINEVLTLRDYSMNNAEKVAFSLVYKKLRELPTTDVVEVNHGEWEKRGFYGHNCSVCDSLNDIDTNYCPNCGAKMDGRSDT